MGILRGSVVDPDKFSSVATRLWRPFVEDKSFIFRAHPDAFRFEPQGSRIHVALAPMPEQIGGIFIPSEQGANPNGLGIVFAVGPMVGYHQTPHPGGVEFEEDSDGASLLYRQVMLKKYAGAPLAFDAVRGTNFFDDIIACQLYDILAVDFPENRPKDSEVDNLHNMLGQQLEDEAGSV